MASRIPFGDRDTQDDLMRGSQGSHPPLRQNRSSTDFGNPQRRSKNFENRTRWLHTSS